jgi:hypothetical protein
MSHIRPSRRMLLAMAGASLVAAPAAAAVGPAITVYKAWGCTCCEGWIGHMQRAGFRPQVVVVNDLSVEWRKRGVPDMLSSCHMGLVGGYVTVGHVPASDVLRLLRERPRAIGLSVPGMPDGSPGMEHPAGKRDRYDTLLLLPGGRSRVWASHA